MPKDKKVLVAAGGWTMSCEPIPTTAAEVDELQKEYMELRETRREGLLSMAEKIEKGEPLNIWEKKIAAANLRHVADTLPMKRKIKRGRPGTLPGDIISKYATLVMRDKLSRNAAAEYLAEKYGTSVAAVKKRLKQDGADNFIATANGPFKFYPKAGPV